jgi:hypothetical protein
VKNEPLKLIRGSGNVYLDLSQGDADVKQLKALLSVVKVETGSLCAHRLHVRSKSLCEPSRSAASQL